jgi:hypothetical protein
MHRHRATLVFILVTGNQTRALTLKSNYLTVVLRQFQILITRVIIVWKQGQSSNANFCTSSSYYLERISLSDCFDALPCVLGWQIQSMQVANLTRGPSPTRGRRRLVTGLSENSRAVKCNKLSLFEQQYHYMEVHKSEVNYFVKA